MEVLTQPPQEAQLQQLREQLELAEDRLLQARDGESKAKAALSNKEEERLQVVLQNDELKRRLDEVTSTLESMKTEMKARIEGYEKNRRGLLEKLNEVRRERSEVKNRLVASQSEQNDSIEKLRMELCHVKNKLAQKPKLKEIESPELDRVVLLEKALRRREHSEQNLLQRLDQANVKCAEMTRLLHCCDNEMEELRRRLASLESTAKDDLGMICYFDAAANYRPGNCRY